MVKISSMQNKLEFKINLVYMVSLHSSLSFRIELMIGR